MAYRGREDKLAGGQGSRCAHICRQEVESGQDVGMVIRPQGVSQPNEHFLDSPHPQLSPHWLSKSNPFSCCDFQGKGEAFMSQFVFKQGKKQEASGSTYPICSGYRNVRGALV